MKSLKQNTFRWTIRILSSFLFTIYAGSAFSQSGFSSTFQTVCASQNVKFCPDNEAGTTYNWTFPGGIPSTSTAKYPTVTYPSVGRYDVQLSVNGGTATLKKKYIRIVVNTDQMSYRTEARWIYGNGPAMGHLNESSMSLNSHTIVTVPNSNIQGASSHTSICNFDGNLLFYVGEYDTNPNNSMWVYNRKHQRMPIAAGVKILSQFSNSQGCLIIPKPSCCDSIYLLITTGYASGIYSGYEINMNADNGKGMVTSWLGAYPYTSTPGYTLTPTFGGLFGSVTAVPHCNGTDYWVVGLDVFANPKKVVAIPVTSAGFGVPIYSYTHTVNTIGEYKGITVSPDRKHLAFAWEDQPSPGTGGLTVMDFDNGTGLASNTHTLAIPSPYNSRGFSSCEFSPNGKYLYATSAYGGTDILRFDLSSVQPHVCTTTSTGLSYMCHLTPALSGNIHFESVQSTWMSTINNPNSASFTVTNQDIPKDGVITDLQNASVSKYYQWMQTQTGLPYDTIICLDSITLISTYSSPYPVTYQWFSGNGGLLTGQTGNSLVVKNADLYILEITVNMNNGCSNKVKAIVEVDKMGTPSLPSNIDVACNSTISLDGGEGFDTYLWNVGSPNNQRFSNISSTWIGPPSSTITLTVTKSTCTKQASIMATIDPCCATPITNVFQASYPSNSANTIPVALFTNSGNNSSNVLQTIDGSSDFNIVTINQGGASDYNYTYASPGGYKATDFVESATAGGKVVIGQKNKNIYVSEIDATGNPVSAHQVYFSFNDTNTFTLEASSIVRSNYLGSLYGYCILINKKFTYINKNEVYLLGMSSNFTSTWIRKVNYSVSSLILHGHKLMAIPDANLSTSSFIVMGRLTVGGLYSGVLIDTKIPFWGTPSSVNTLERTGSHIYFNGSVLYGSAGDPIGLLFTGSSDAKEFSRNSVAAILKTPMSIAASPSYEKIIPDYRMSGRGILQKGTNGHSVLLIQSMPVDDPNSYYYYHNLELDDQLNIVSGAKLVSIEGYETTNDHDEYVYAKTIFSPTAEQGYTVLGADRHTFFLHKTDTQLNGNCTTQRNTTIKVRTTASSGVGSTSAASIIKTNTGLLSVFGDNTKGCCGTTYNPLYDPCKSYHGDEYTFNFTSADSEYWSNGPITFHDTSTYPAADVNHYEWDFGDGVFVNTTLKNQSHTYQWHGPGSQTYTVTHTIYLTNGCTRIIRHTITIHCQMPISVSYQLPVDYCESAGGCLTIDPRTDPLLIGQCPGKAFYTIQRISLAPTLPSTIPTAMFCEGDHWRIIYQGGTDGCDCILDVYVSCPEHIVQPEYGSNPPTNSRTNTDLLNKTVVEELKGTISPVSIYPNPSNGVFNLFYRNAGDLLVYEVIVYDYSGKVVQKRSNMKVNTVEQLDLSGFSCGVYTVRVRSENYRRNFLITKS